MIRSALAAAVVLNLGGRTDKTTEINQGLDFALGEFTKSYGWKELTTTSDILIVVATTPEYVTLPANTSHVQRAGLINGANSWMLPLKTRAWLEARWPNVASDSHGPPKYCYEDKTSGRLYLYPISDSAYSVRVTISKLVTSFTSDATECPVVGLDLALIAWATSYVFQTTEQFINAAWWRDQAELARAMAERADRKSREELRMSVPEVGENEWLLSATPWLDPFVRNTV